jgi:aminotransferase
MELLSHMARNYPASIIRKMFELANQYPNAIKLTVGEPNFDTPQHIKDAATRALNNNHTHYVSNAGLPELRQAIADRYTREFKQHYTSKNVMVAFGGMEAIFLALAATLNPGDEVLVTDPSYPNYLGQIAMFGAKAVTVPVYEHNEFKLMAVDVENAITPRTKALFLNSPNNPVGAVLDKRHVEQLAEVVARHQLIVYSDEVYDKIIYDGHEHFSMAQISEVRDRVLVINSFSKSYAMTGWRVGYVVGNETIISCMPMLQEATASCVPPFIQKAAVEALIGPQTVIEEMVGHYRRRRNLFIQGLNEIPGFQCIMSPGSFYAFPNIKAFGRTSEQFALELLSEAGVAAIPGTAFGAMGEGYLRFSFANSDENLQEAVARIKHHISKKY